MHCSTLVTNGIELKPAVLGKILKEFTIYGHGGHTGHVTLIIYLHVGSHFQYMLHVKVGFDWPSGFREVNL